MYIVHVCTSYVAILLQIFMHPVTRRVLEYFSHSVLYSILSAKLSFQSSELDPLHPQGVLLLPSLGARGGKETHYLGGRGCGNPVSTKGQTLLYVLYIIYFSNI